MTDYVPQDLVNAFVASAERHFLTLELCHSLQRSLEAEVYGPQGLHRVRHEEIGNRFFMLKLSLTGPSFSVVISYGDREHDLSCVICSKHFEEAYALWEWLDVLDKRELIEDHGGWVLTEARVEAVLAQIEHVLEQLAPAIAGADPAIEHQLKQHRQERERLGQQQMAVEEHSRLAFKAAGAFHRQDYRTVVEALSAVRCGLTPGEQAKLAYARKKLRN